MRKRFLFGWFCLEKSRDAPGRRNGLFVLRRARREDGGLLRPFRGVFKRPDFRFQIECRSF